MLELLQFREDVLLQPLDLVESPLLRGHELGQRKAPDHVNRFVCPEDFDQLLVLVQESLYLKVRNKRPGSELSPNSYFY